MYQKIYTTLYKKIKKYLEDFETLPPESIEKIFSEVDKTRYESKKKFFPKEIHSKNFKDLSIEYLNFKIKDVENESNSKIEK